MDEQVLRAMARWPDVPAAYGWLRLGRRGQWFLIDRNMPGFDERRHGEGSAIGNEQIREFIGRNYQADADGRWYWQNGPQRAYADLEAAPLVARVLGTALRPALVDHTGVEIDIAAIEAAGIGPAGELLLATDRGAAVIHDLDLGSLIIEAGEDGEAAILVLGERRIELAEWDDPPAQLGFVAKPRPTT